MRGVREINEFTIKNKLGEAIEILLTATVLHKGWECDNEAWLVRMKSGALKAFTTNHGSLVQLDKRELNRIIVNTERSLSELQLMQEHLK